MFKSQFIYTLLLCSLLTYSQQRKDTFFAPLENVNVIVFTFSDEVIINTSNQTDKISVKSELFTKGKIIIGRKHRKKDPSFKIIFFKKNDTLFIKDPETKGFNGISFTYSETIKTKVILPYNKKIIIKNGRYVQIKGIFEGITTENISKLKLTGLNKKELKQLTCKSYNITVNSEERINNYKYIGQGSKIYTLEAEEVILSIK